MQKKNSNESLPTRKPGWYLLSALGSGISRLLDGSEGSPETIVYRHTCRNCGRAITAPGEGRRFVHEDTGSKFCNPTDAADREWYIRAALKTAEVQTYAQN
jgi:hypothetical protein